MSTTEKRPVIEVTGLKKQYKLGQIGGGTLTADVWMPENIVYQLWEGTIAAPGIRCWPETHVLSDTVTIVDPLDAEAADE